MSKEEIIEEIKLNAVDIIFNREAEWSDKLEKVIDLWLSKAIDKTREETIREVEEMLDNYFEGLIVVPYPELTRDQIKKHLNKLRK